MPVPVRGRKIGMYEEHFEVVARQAGESDRSAVGEKHVEFDGGKIVRSESAAEPLQVCFGEERVRRRTDASQMSTSIG